MISTLQQLLALSPVLALSRWIRTDLILAATLLFLVFASSAMLLSGHSGGAPERGANADPAIPTPGTPARAARSGRVFGTFGVVLGLLGSLALLAICAW